MKFGLFSRKFLEKRRILVLSREISAPTLNSDEILLERMLPAFARKRLCEITPSQIDKFLDLLILKGKAPATRNRYRALLHTIFKYAIRAGYCKRNPVAEIPILSEKIKRRQVDYWKTNSERDRYIEAAFKMNAVYGMGAMIMCLGGPRVSEMLALQFGDIEWDRNYIRVRRIIERMSVTVQDRTKGQRAGGEYQMLMLPRLKAELVLWVQRSPYKKPTDFIVHRPDGRFFDYDTYAKIHEKIILRAGVKRITLHDIRRTFASSMERAGFHKAEIGEALGHETLSATEAYTLMDVSHLVDKANRVGFGK